MATPLIRRVVSLLALLLLTTACRYETIDGVGTRTADPEFPPQADVSLIGCRPEDGQRWRATGIIVNHTDQVQTYEVTIAFSDAETRLAERAHWVRALRPGEMAEIDRSWWIESAERVDGCRLLTVNRFA